MSITFTCNWASVYIQCKYPQTNSTITVCIFQTLQMLSHSQNACFPEPCRCLVLLAPLSECRSAASLCYSIRSKLCTSRPTKRRSKGRIRETWSEDHHSIPAAQPSWTEMVREVVSLPQAVCLAVVYARPCFFKIYFCAFLRWKSVRFFS